jgi:hypothetical protein
MDISKLANEYQNALSINEIAKLVPGRPHTATIWRWITRGVKGRKLASITVGGRRLVTLAALEEFLFAPTSSATTTESDDVDTIRRAREAGKALESLGC